ncbi:MAG: hypothetical protein WCF36_02275 [Candidatus Nanopelagicales bacterium]
MEREASQQPIHDFPALAACGELLAMLSDVDSHDPNGGAEHGGGGAPFDAGTPTAQPQGPRPWSGLAGPAQVGR